MLYNFFEVNQSVIINPLSPEMQFIAGNVKPKFFPNIAQYARACGVRGLSGETLAHRALHLREAVKGEQETSLNVQWC